MLNVLLEYARTPGGSFYSRIQPDGQGGFLVDRKSETDMWPRLLQIIFEFGRLSANSQYYRYRSCSSGCADIPIVRGNHSRYWNQPPFAESHFAPRREWDLTAKRRLLCLTGLSGDKDPQPGVCQTFNRKRYRIRPVLCSLREGQISRSPAGPVE